MVLLSMPEHDDLAWDIALQLAAPGAWLLPVAALMLGLALRRGMQPMAELSAQVEALDVRHPQGLAGQPRHRELQQLVHAINTLVARYHAALANERQLAGEIAHELRTPLASLGLHAASLRGSLTAEERVQALDRIEYDARRAASMLGELLALARASRVELEEATLPCDLVAIARQVLGDHAQAALDSGHELSLRAPEALTLRGHPMLLELALRNLIENALSHTPAGTAIELTLDAQGRWLQVSDDGARRAPAGAPGPAPAAASTGAASAAGTGLGLGLGHRVVQKVAAIHGGHFGAVAARPPHTTAYRMTWSDDTGA